MTSHPLSNQEILFTRQRHEADKMGLHWDYRFVLGDKAYSWATKKEMPEPGKSILLFEQPIHDREYALSPTVVIPKGNYGAGTTTLDFVQKAKVVGYDDEPGKLVINTKDGKKFLLKKLTSGAYFEKYGDKAWLFRNLATSESQEKKAALDFSPDLTPVQMEALGVLASPGSKYNNADPTKANFFKVKASLDTWPETWHNEQHPLGWFEWYKGYASGKRTDDDERQIKRWISFKARHLAQLKKADPTLADFSVQPRRRQALLNWGIAPGINVEEEIQKREQRMNNKYLTKVALFGFHKNNKQNPQSVQQQLKLTHYNDTWALHDKHLIADIGEINKKFPTEGATHKDALSYVSHVKAHMRSHKALHEDYEALHAKFSNDMAKAGYKGAAPKYMDIVHDQFEKEIKRHTNGRY